MFYNAMQNRNLHHDFEIYVTFVFTKKLFLGFS